MPDKKRRNILRWKRRVDEDGEDEGSVAAELPDDSQSDETGVSDEADADNSDLSDSDESKVALANGPMSIPSKLVSRVNGNADGLRTRDSKAGNVAKSPKPAEATTLVADKANFVAVADTEVMMSGLSAASRACQDEGLSFDTLEESNKLKLLERSTTATGTTSLTQNQVQGNNKPETPTERRRREHEEYKKKRDTDPAFIPNRGAFFMHDHRSLPGLAGYRSSTRGRGRGKVSGLSARANPTAEVKEPTSGIWAHDLHHTLNETENRQFWQFHAQKNLSNAPSAFTTRGHKPVNPRMKALQPTRSFSKTTHVANVQIRILLPGMGDPITFFAVPVRQHTKLPNHRPPLRRDKPVRISLPDQAPRYIFPSTDKSFIFIPRALRPNQQGFGRGKAKGALSTYGAFSSRRTSLYGGSMNSSSIVPSRRSSLAREIARDGIISPSGSSLSRPPMQGSEGVKPVVRLPQGVQHTPDYGQMSYVSMASTGNPVINANFNFPPKPELRENWSKQIPMHQPRPQKAVSVAGIEPSASQSFHIPQTQEQQPFHQQMPSNLQGLNASAFNAYSDSLTHNRQVSFISQAGSVGTPLSNISERAIHAPTFQPIHQTSYAEHFPSQMATLYYPNPIPPEAASQGQIQQYPNNVAAASSAIMAPVFVPGTQAGAYVVPPGASGVPPVSGSVTAGSNGDPTNVPAEHTPQPAGMVAHESNGMVYYFDPSQIYQSMEGYHPQNIPAPFAYTFPSEYGGSMAAPSPGSNYYYPQSHMSGVEAMAYPAS